MRNWSTQQEGIFYKDILYTLVTSIWCVFILHHTWRREHLWINLYLSMWALFESMVPKLSWEHHISLSDWIQVHRNDSHEQISVLRHNFGRTCFVFNSRMFFVFSPWIVFFLNFRTISILSKLCFLLPLMVIYLIIGIFQKISLTST